MILKSFHPVTSTKRFQKKFIFLSNPKVSSRVYNKKLKLAPKFCSSTSGSLSLGLRKQAVYPQILLFSKIYKYQKFICVKSLFSKLAKKEFGIFVNAWGCSLVWPKLSSVVIGKRYFMYIDPFNAYKLKSPLNSFITLEYVPFNFFVSYLQNIRMTKFSFVMSNGTYATKLKSVKSNRLISILLPSSQILFFNKNIICLVGSLKNKHTKYIVFGKQGSIFKKKFYTHVRGVAKNPVDHPNGGRTKAKQPEKSPWGWIAKCNR